MYREAPCNLHTTSSNVVFLYNSSQISKSGNLPWHNLQTLFSFHHLYMCECVCIVLCNYGTYVVLCNCHLNQVAKIFNQHKSPSCYPFITINYPAISNLVTTDLFFFLIVLLFPECYIERIIEQVTCKTGFFPHSQNSFEFHPSCLMYQYLYLFCSIVLRDMDIPQFAPVCLTIYLLKDI